MPHLRAFEQGLASIHGDVPATILAARMQARYDTLYPTRPRFAHPALRWHLTDQILPGLALYQTLRDSAAERGLTPQAALAETGVVLQRLDVMANRLPLLRHVPFTFALFRRAAVAMLLLYPSKGWDIQVVENSQRSFAFTVTRCFYIEVLTAYGAPELTPHFCQLDDIAFAGLPPCITWERSTTLARGGACCDFRWRQAPVSVAARSKPDNRNEARADSFGIGQNSCTEVSTPVPMGSASE
jgi:hypothetical protein